VMAWWSLEIGMLLAQAEGAPGAAPVGDAGAPWLPSFEFMLILLGIMFYFMIFRPQMRERSDHRKMLAALKKNDRVLTSGGMFGTVAMVANEGDEVILKI